jgi:FtsH-binding integral membrane protein
MQATISTNMYYGALCIYIYVYKYVLWGAQHIYIYVLWGALHLFVSVSYVLQHSSVHVVFTYVSCWLTAVWNLQPCLHV